MPCKKLVPVVGCQGPGTPTACGFCQKLTAATPSLNNVLGNRMGTSIQLRHSGTVSQTNSLYNGSWAVSFEFSMTSREPHAVHITVDIHLVDNGAGLAEVDRVEWKTHILQAWSNKYKFVDRLNGANWYAVFFDIQWRNNAWPANQRYQVRVDPPATDFPTTMSPQQQNMTKTMLPEGRALRQDVARHRDAPTRNMGVWGKGDKQAVLHEFGHMIGCPDEYDLTACSDPNNYVTAYATAYNVPGYTTDSVMNNPDSASRIYPRHFDYVRRVFEAWNQAPLKPLFTRDQLKVAPV